MSTKKHTRSHAQAFELMVFLFHDITLADDSKKVKRTEAELALKRSEMARRRRYQSDKKLEDEKTETINRLLKKQVGRKSTREQARDNQAAADGDEQEDEEDDDDDDQRAGGGEGGSRKKIRTAESERARREELKRRPRPFFRTVISKEGTTVSVPAGTATSDPQGLYMAKWQSTFPGPSRPKIEVLEETAPQQTIAAQ